MSLKIAIVGCGKIADAHVEEIRKIACARLVAVCDREPLMAEQLAVRYGVSHWYCDFEQMLATEAPDVVHVTVPPHAHAPLVRRALDANCHIFLEKPVGTNFRDTQAIVSAVRGANRKLTVNYWPNFEAPALKLRRLIEAGLIGEVVHLESFYGYDLSGEYGTALRRDPNHWVRRLPGRLFQNVLDHVLNKIAPFLRTAEPLIHATAYRGGVNNRHPGQHDLLDELRVVIEDAGMSAYATFSSHARPVGHSLRVYGTRNTATVNFAMRTVTLDRKQAFPSALGRLFPPLLTAKDYLGQGIDNLHRFAHARFHYFDGMRNLLTEFYRSIEQDSALPIPYEEILRVSRMMETIFHQVYPEVLV